MCFVWYVFVCLEHLGWSYFDEQLVVPPFSHLFLKTPGSLPFCVMLLNRPVDPAETPLPPIQARQTARAGGSLRGLWKKAERQGKHGGRKLYPAGLSNVFLSNAFSWLIVSHILGNLSPPELSSSLSPGVELVHLSTHCAATQNLYMEFVFSFLLTFSLVLNFPESWLISEVWADLRVLGFWLTLISLHKEGWVHTLRGLLLYSGLETWSFFTIKYNFNNIELVSY